MCGYELGFKDSWPFCLCRLGVIIVFSFEIVKNQKEQHGLSVGTSQGF